MSALFVIDADCLLTQPDGYVEAQAHNALMVLHGRRLLAGVLAFPPSRAFREGLHPTAQRLTLPHGVLFRPEWEENLARTTRALGARAFISGDPHRLRLAREARLFTVAYGQAWNPHRPASARLPQWDVAGVRGLLRLADGHQLLAEG